MCTMGGVVEVNFQMLMHSPLRLLQRVLLTVVLCVSAGNVPSLSYNPWQVISLPTRATCRIVPLLTQHAWVVGSAATILETRDGGQTWQPINLVWMTRSTSFLP